MDTGSAGIAHDGDEASDAVRVRFQVFMQSDLDDSAAAAGTVAVNDLNRPDVAAADTLVVEVNELRDGLRHSAAVEIDGAGLGQEVLRGAALTGTINEMGVEGVRVERAFRRPRRTDTINT